jgi:hypothetical protein
VIALADRHFDANRKNIEGSYLDAISGSAFADRMRS